MALALIARLVFETTGLYVGVYFLSSLMSMAFFFRSGSFFLVKKQAWNFLL